MGKLIVGCGYLGARVAALWRKQGEQVFATTRHGDRAAALRGLGLEPIVCDVLQPESLQRLPAVDTVLYCVGLDRASGANMRQVYVEGLAKVLDRLPEPGRFLHVSSTSVYGQTGGEEVDESADTQPLDESGRIVLEAERLLHARVPKAVILRFAGIYGPERLLRQRDIGSGPARRHGSGPLAEPDPRRRRRRGHSGLPRNGPRRARSATFCDGHPVPAPRFLQPFGATAARAHPAVCSGGCTPATAPARPGQPAHQQSMPATGTARGAAISSLSRGAARTGVGKNGAALM